MYPTKENKLIADSLPELIQSNENGIRCRQKWDITNRCKRMGQEQGARKETGTLQEGAKMKIRFEHQVTGSGRKEQ